ncbi:cupin domain-containing protein [Desulfovibrio piger]|uniref:cupin domain-containing protein n=1 Tax=Desulfovibrio piger TaxID=901 RepID=UPI0039F63204
MTATTSLAQALSAQDIIRHYDLMPHVEGGHYRRIWCSSQDLQPESLPCGICGSRPCSTSILYLLQAGERSRLHRIRQDELWHFHLGGPLRLYCLTPDGQELDRILGADILAGQHLLLPMPGGCWFGAEPCPGTDFSLVSCTVAPGFDFRDFELAKAACLVRRYPFAKERIEHFCQLPDGCPDPGEGGRA